MQEKFEYTVQFYLLHIVTMRRKEIMEVLFLYLIIAHSCFRVFAQL